MMMMIMIIILILIIIIMIIFLRPGNTGLMSSRGEASSLALVDNPSRDGVSIKILVWRHLEPNP